MHDEDKGSSSSEFRTTGEIEIDMTVDNFFSLCQNIACRSYLSPTHVVRLARRGTKVRVVCIIEIQIGKTRRNYSATYFIASFVNS